MNIYIVNNYLIIAITSTFLCFCPCFTLCKNWTFYTIFEILHSRNLKHNYKLIYYIEINLQLDIKMYLHLFYTKIIVLYKYQYIYR